MDNQDFRRVEAWLYSIPRIEIALENLKIELERLETRRQSTPTWMPNPNAVPVTGGQLDSRQQKWVEFLSEYDERKRELQEQIRYRENQIECFQLVMNMLRQENAQLVQLVRKKYIEKVQPDWVIWKRVLFVGKTKFYEMRQYAVQSFFECLPAQFLKKRTKGELKRVNFMVL